MRTYLAIAAVIMLLTGCASEGASPGQRDGAVQEVESTLNSLRDEIEELRSRAENAPPETRSQLEGVLNRLQQVEEGAEAKLEELRSAGDEAWQTAKSDLDSVIEELDSTIEEARQTLDEQISRAAP